MAPSQKSWLVNKSSKLGKIELPDLLRKDEAWTLLAAEDRQRLYSMLPQPQEGEPQHDIDVNPMQTMYRPYIEAELRRWQDDLTEGKETKAWREQAIEAGRQREKGVWNEWKEAQRELDWGVGASGNENGGDEGNGNGNGGKEVEKDDEAKHKDDVDEVENEDQKETAKKEAS